MEMLEGIDIDSFQLFTSPEHGSSSPNSIAVKDERPGDLAVLKRIGEQRTNHFIQFCSLLRDERLGCAAISRKDYLLGIIPSDKGGCLLYKGGDGNNYLPECCSHLLLPKREVVEKKGYLSQIRETSGFHGQE